MRVSSHPNRTKGDIVHNPSDSDSDIESRGDCCLLSGLIYTELGPRSRRQLEAARSHAENGEGWALVVQQGPGKNARPEVMYAGAPAIKNLITSTVSDLYPPKSERVGRTNGRT